MNVIDVGFGWIRRWISVIDKELKEVWMNEVGFASKKCSKQRNWVGYDCVV